MLTLRRKLQRTKLDLEDGLGGSGDGTRAKDVVIRA